MSRLTSGHTPPWTTQVKAVYRGYLETRVETQQAFPDRIKYQNTAVSAKTYKGKTKLFLFFWKKKKKNSAPKPYRDKGIPASPPEKPGSGGALFGCNSPLCHLPPTCGAALAASLPVSSVAVPLSKGERSHVGRCWCSSGLAVSSCCCRGDCRLMMCPRLTGQGWSGRNPERMWHRSGRLPVTTVPSPLALRVPLWSLRSRSWGRVPSTTAAWSWWSRGPTITEMCVAPRAGVDVRVHGTGLRLHSLELGRTWWRAWK